MLDLLVSGECVISAKRLLVVADFAPHLLALGVVNGVFVTSKIVRPRKDGVARLASCGIDAGALVRPCMLSADTKISAHGSSMTVGLAPMLGHLASSREPKRTSVHSAAVSSTAGGGIFGPWVIFGANRVARNRV